MFFRDLGSTGRENAGNIRSQLGSDPFDSMPSGWRIGS
jgi:hypothetical protein